VAENAVAELIFFARAACRHARRVDNHMHRTRWLFLVVLLWACSPWASAQHIIAFGVHRAADCEPVTRPLIDKLHGIGYPREWTIVVACTASIANRLQRKGDARRTVTAFTNLRQRLTAINRELFLKAAPLQGTSQPTARAVLRHEHGHIVCACADEHMADKIEGPEK